MNRRTFIQRSLCGSMLLAPYLAYSRHRGTLSLDPAQSRVLPYDLVAVKGGNPSAMFDKGIEALGGIKQFVKKGQTVVVKPNIGWDVKPDRGGNTHPALVARIIRHCYEAGAKRVYVFDHTCDDWKSTYATSGIEAAAKDAGATVAPAHVEGYYHELPVPQGKSLKSAKVHELILDSDVFINVPVLKHHSSTRLTVTMKNLMGVVWDRGWWHANDLQQCIADFARCRKPDLNVVDAYLVMKRNGPRGVSVEDVVTMKSLLLSTDMVTADVAAAKLFGTNPETIPYIELAGAQGAGQKDLSKISIKRLTI